MPNVSANIDTFLLSADNAAARTNLGVSGVISTPKVYYVESTGNDSTGAVGNPALPYATGTAAEAAGHAAGVTFSIKFGVGTFSIIVNTRALSSYLSTIFGCGAAATEVSVTTTPANVDSIPGTNAPALAVNAYQMTLVAVNNGGTGSDSLEANGLPGGNGGTVIISGDCSLYVTAMGGAGFGFESPGNDGSAGSITISGGCVLQYATTMSVNFPFSVGAFIADGCDLRPAGNFSLNFYVIDIGRCSYTGFTPAGDRGGNAFY